MAVAVGVLAVAATLGAATRIDVMGATPVGSWQEREMVTTDAKGQQTVTVMKTKYLGDEQRGGTAYAWIETEVQGYEVKKDGKRKAQGELMVMKALVARSVFAGDTSNVVANLSRIGEEVIMQSGSSQPMRIKGAGGMLQGAMQSMNLQVDYDYKETGRESVSVPAGSFDCVVYKGAGTTTMDVVFKKMQVESSATAWFSSEVPFGLVRMTSEDTVDGQKQTSEARLLAHGAAGATTRITGEVMDMPTIPGFPGG